MSENDKQVPSALVAVGDKALTVRSAALVKRGLALAKSLKNSTGGLERRYEKLSEEQGRQTIKEVVEHLKAQEEKRRMLAAKAPPVKVGELGVIDHTVIRLQPDDALPHYNLGLALYHKGDLDGAIAEYRTAIRLQPDYAAARYSLGVALKGKGDLDGAIAEYRTAIRLQSGDADADDHLLHLHLGDALRDEGDLAGGIAKLCTLCLRLELCDALYSKGDFDGAIAEYRIAIRLQPDDEHAHLCLGFALYEKGDLEGAIAEFRIVIRLQLDDGDVPCLHLGDALVEKGDLDGAIAEFRTAIRLRPDYANDMAHLGLGLALEMKGDRLGALDEIEKVRERFPTDSMIAEAYERIRRKAGNG